MYIVFVTESTVRHLALLDVTLSLSLLDKFIDLSCREIPKYVDDEDEDEIPNLVPDSDDELS